MYPSTTLFYGWLTNPWSQAGPEAAFWWVTYWNKPQFWPPRSMALGHLWRYRMFWSSGSQASQFAQG